MDALFADPVYQRHNPYRFIDWRWGSAQWAAAEDGPRPPRLDDPDTAAAADYLREQAACASDADREQLRQKWPALHAAEELAAGGTPRLWEAQARLLAGQGDEEVAALCGLTPDAVRWYEALFFNVRDRLGGRDWIMTQAVGGGPWDSFGGGKTAVLWRYFAYTAGPLLLDLVIAVTTKRPFPDSIRRSLTGNVADEESRLRLACKLTLALLAARSPQEVKVLAEAREQLRRLDEQAESGPGEPSPILREMERFLASLADAGRGRPHKKPAASSFWSVNLSARAGARTTRRRGATTPKA